MTLLSFTDAQLAMIVQGARPLHPLDRADFLETLISELPADRALDNAAVRRAVAVAQRALRVV
jgi:hypothetical protein